MSKYSPTKFKHSPIASLVALTLGLSSSLLSAQEADEEKEKQGLETITVTAQKRAQNLQEVPVSVTAFSGDQMAESVIKDMYDLTTNTPGMGAFQSQSATNSSFSIRGVGTSSQNFGLESSVGLYVDGVYRARQNSMINNLVDVEAVEVLRGPQGTLFGKNTPSGAILVRTKAPSHDGEDGFFEATVGNFGLFNYSGAASVSAIEDVLAFRVTAFGSQRDGIVSDVNLGDDKLNDRDRWGARLQALYTPSSDLSIRIIADYSNIDEICCAAPVQLSNNKLGADGSPGSDLLLGSPLFGATIFPGGDAFYNREVALSFLPESSMTDKGLSAEINWDLDDNYSLVSISAYRKFESLDLIDTDFTDANLFFTSNDSRQNSFSQELRIDYSSEKLNYILGVYYFSQDLDLDYNLETQNQFGTFYNVAVLPSVMASPLGGLINGLNGLSAATGGLIAPIAAASGDAFSFYHVAEQEHESYAIFGQFDYKLTDELTLTAGLRYTDESKDLSTVFSELDPQGNQLVPADFTTAGYYLGLIAAGQLSPFDENALAAFAPLQTPGWGFPLIGATTSGRPNINETLQDDQISGTLKLSFQPNNDTLIYASYGNGYKSGGTNTDRIANGFEPVFDAETSQSFEVGLKKDFPEQDFRINGAIHYTTVSDFQANTFTGNGFNLQNAGDYKISGLELEATWLPLDTVEVNFGYARVNAEYDTFEKGNCWVANTWHTGEDDPGRQNPTDRFCDRAGDRPGGEPEDYAVIKVKKDFEIGDIYAYIQAEYSYTGEIVLDGSNDPLTIQDSYNVLNLRFFMNFTDLDMDVIFWGRNVLDEEYINRTDFNTPLQAGKLNAYVSEPATYGVTLRKRF